MIEDGKIRYVICMTNDTLKFSVVSLKAQLMSLMRIKKLFHYFYSVW